MVHHRKYPLFYLYPLPWGVKVTRNVAQYLLHNVTYAHVKLCPMVKEDMHLQENTLYDLDLVVVKVTQNVVQYPSNHMTYAPAKFEVASFNSLGEE